MIFSNPYLYFFTFVAALLLSLILTPAARSAALVLDVLDHPSTAVKTHKRPVPYLGGAAIFISFSFSLLWLRILTSFPTGTLRSLRGILLGGAVIFLLGLIDDVKHRGLHYRTKFFYQALAAGLVLYFGIGMKFIHPTWVATFITILWVVGLTNAFNLIDIMDGLASGVAVVAAAAFLFISLPTEEIYVNFASAALCGSALGFLPYNLSKNWRIFMGDSGSLFLGFVLSSLALGTSYTEHTDWGVFAPLLILTLPLYDTVLVAIIRIRRGMSPFLGSKDHFCLRLEALGWPRSKILIFSLASCLVFSMTAYLVTQADGRLAVTLYLLVGLAILTFTSYILKAKIQ